MCRILSLDGGGSWALIQVRALIALYPADTLGQAVLADFDIVAANSGGSLVLAGLVENLPLGTLLSYFEDEAKRRSIFAPSASPTDWLLRKVLGLGPKYSADAKLPALRQLLPAAGDLPLPVAAARVPRRPGAAGPIHLLITSFDYDRNRAAFFRSAPTTDPVWGYGAAADATLAEAVHASANPPVNYFDGPAFFPSRSGRRYWDGGIAGCNNPVLVAVTEAIQLGHAPTEIAALSIGTGTVRLPWPRAGDAPSPFLARPADQGLISDLKKLAVSILDDPPDIATFLAYMHTGGNQNLPPPLASRIVRMNPLISPVKAADGAWIAPASMTPDEFVALANLDFDAVEQAQVDTIARYAQAWLNDNAPNQPIRMDGDTLALEIGDARFAGAAARWARLSSHFP